MGYENEVIIQANGIWKVIERNTSAKPDKKKENSTLSYLYLGLPESLTLQVAGCKTPYDVWNTLKTRFVGIDEVQQARLQ